MNAMSRNKKQNPAALLIIWVMGLLLIIFTVLATLLIWVGWAICEQLYARYPRNPSEAEILLQEDEAHELAQTETRIRQIETRLAQIESEGRDLRRRKDGLFHAGSVLGTKLNAEIGQLLHELSDNQAICLELQTLPGERLRDWAAPLSRLLALRWAVAIYISCSAYALLFKPASVIYMHGLILDWLQAYLPNLSLPVYGAMALASIIATCAGAAAYWLYSRLIYNHYAPQLEPD